MSHRIAPFRRVAFTIGTLVVALGCGPDASTSPAGWLARAPEPGGRTSSVLPATVVYGPATFVRATGKPRTDSATFAAIAGDNITFVISSTDPQGLNGTITLSGAPLLSITGGNDLPATVTAVAQATNTLRIYMSGKPGASITIVASIPTQPLPSGVVLYYPLNGNAIDASGSGLHATVTNGEWVPDRHGSVGGAFHVPTNNAWGLAPFPAGSPISFPTSGQFSASMWVRADSLPRGPESGVIFDVGVTDFGWGFSIRPGGILIAQVCTPNDFCHSTDENAGDVPNTPLVPGQWVHLAMMYDGVAGRLTFYLNGQRVGYSAFALSPHTTDTEVWFGTAPYATQYWFAGAMDEIRVYNRFFAPGELSSLSAY